MLQHVAKPDPQEDGLWVVAYQIPGTNQFSVVGCGYPERQARTEANRLNRLGEEADRRALELANTKPEDRRIAPGLYSDENP